MSDAPNNHLDSGFPTASINRPDTIVVPRWVVYLQGALLGVIATTFFIFGLMVGNMTSSAAPQIQLSDCQVSGTVMYATGADSKPDRGAVVVLLPQNREPDSRAEGRWINPDDFEPLDNPGIDMVNRLGGAVVRADDGGRFEVFVDRPGKYDVLIISRARKRPERIQLTKKQTATLGTFYFPVQAAVGDHSFYWGEFTAREKPLELDRVEFK